MELPRHFIETGENKVSLRDYESWESFEDLTPYSNTVGSMLSHLNFYVDLPVTPSKDPAGFKKGLHEEAARAFGPRIHRNLPAAMYNTFIKNNFDMCTYFALRYNGSKWKRFDPLLVNSAIKHKVIVKELERDNLLHLLPVAVGLGMDPSTAKDKLGKSLWKKIANNSKTRNKLLLKRFVGRNEVERLEELAGMRSGILKQIGCFFHYADLIAGKISPTVEQYRLTQHLVTDTLRMSRQLGLDYNPNWSYKRWQKEHEERSKELLSRRYSKEPFDQPHTCTIDRLGLEYTFTRLVSPAEIAVEGSQMRHCVASYANRAAKGWYEVYKVEGNGERATLGMVYDSNGQLTLDQIYGFCNSPVSHEMFDATNIFIVGENTSEDSSGRRSGRISRRGDQDTCPEYDFFGRGIPEVPF